MNLITKFERLVSNTFCNVGQSFYDSYVEVNTSFRSLLGMKTTIIRRQLGNCCKWCANLAGIYDYDNRPDDIFRRHSNCRCLVTTKSEKGYTNVWNKTTYNTQKEARKKYINELSIIEQKDRKYELRKRELISKGEVVYDATEEWFDKANPNSATIMEKKKVVVDGIEHRVGELTINGKLNTFINLKEYEKTVLEVFVNTFGGCLEYYPVIKIPEGTKCPDCLYNGERFDLKSVLGSSENNIINAIKNKERQAHSFIIDITNAKYDIKYAAEQAKGIFSDTRTTFVERIVLMYENNVIAIFEKLNK